MNRFSKTCLLLIVVLLAIIAFRPFFAPQSAEAAHHYKYLAVQIPVGYEEHGHPVTVQDALNKYSADGWELVQVTPEQLFFRK